MTKTLIRGALVSALAISAVSGPALAQDWKSELPAFRIGLLGGENEADRLRRNECMVAQLTDVLGVKIELYPASDYAGVMQGLLAGQLDAASLGASGYAGIHLQDPNAVEPVFVSLESDGSNGYVAMMYARTDSGIKSLDEMKGRSLAFADPNSTSGYLVPKFQLEQRGIDIESYFSATGFGGGHEQAVIAVLNGQYDAGVTWTSGQGEKAEGFSRGNFRTMVNNGLVNMDDLEIIWTSDIIPNGPWVIRQAVPAEAKELWAGWMENLRDADYACYVEVSQGEGAGFQRVDHSFYEGIVEMRRAELQGSR